MKTLLGTELNASDRQHVLAAYVYRNTVENIRRNAAAVKRAGGSLPPITDAQWLEITQFTVTNAGRLDQRVHHCHLIPAWKSAIDAWSAKGGVAA
jgi:hypothetical protein